MKNVWITLYEINLVLCFSLDKIPFCTSITIQIAHSSLLWFKEKQIFLSHGCYFGATDNSDGIPIFWLVLRISILHSDYTPHRMKLLACFLDKMIFLQGCFED